MKQAFIVFSKNRAGKLEGYLSHFGREYALHGDDPGRIATMICQSVGLDPKEVRVEFDSVVTFVESDLEITAARSSSLRRVWAGFRE